MPEVTTGDVTIAYDVFPGARFVEIPEASHLGVFTHGEAVAHTLIDFFGRI